MQSPSRSQAIRTLVAGATAFAVPRVARAQSLPTVRVALFPSEASGQLYYAREQGYFERNGLTVELTELKNGAAIAAAVASGAIDVGVSNLVTMAIGHERGLPFTLIAGAGLSIATAPTNGILAVATTSAFHTAKDLTGKIVAVDGLGSMPHIACQQWIDTTGGDSTGVKFIELGFPEMSEAIRTGRIDAAIVNFSIAPTIGKPGDPLRVLAYVYNAVAPRFFSSIWFSSTDWVAKNQETARKFVVTMRDGATWGNAHKHEAAIAIAKVMKKTAESVEATPRTVFLTELTPALVQPLIDLSAKYGRIKTAFPAREIISSVALH